jgi:hypothetical protein
VTDIVEGLTKYDTIMANNKSQSAAFLTVFGVPCVRETLRQKRSFLEKVQSENEELYDKFVAMGRIHAARWVYFESEVLGTKIRGKQRLVFLAQDTNDEDIGRYVYLNCHLQNFNAIGSSTDAVY